MSLRDWCLMCAGANYLGAILGLLGQVYPLIAGLCAFVAVVLTLQCAGAKV